MNAAEIIEFDERYSRRFADLNYQWIAETYGIEPHDSELLDHPTSINNGRRADLFRGRQWRGRRHRRAHTDG